MLSERVGVNEHDAGRLWPLVIIRSTSLTKVVGRVVRLISQYSMPSCIFPSRFQRDENNQSTDQWQHPNDCELTATLRWAV